VGIVAAVSTPAGADDEELNCEKMRVVVAAAFGCFSDDETPSVG
jgi:hypothetical protein